MDLLSRRSCRAGLAAGFTLPLIITVLPSTASAAGGRAAVNSDRPSYSTTGTPSSAVAGSTPVDFQVDLPVHDQAALQALVRSVSTPGSSSYRKFLTPAQYTARFSASQADIETLSKYLKDQGFTITETSPTRSSLAVSGTAAKVAATFGTGLRAYATATSGKLVAPASALTLPTSIASLVSGVRGLAEIQHLATPHNKVAGSDVSGSENKPSRTDPAKVKKTRQKGGGAPPSPGFLNAGPCSTFYGQKLATGTPPVNGVVQPYAVCGYTPAQIQSGYGIDRAIQGRSPIDGRGTTVAITDAYNSPTANSDASTYSSKHGLPAFTNGQYSTVLPNKQFRFGYNDAVNGDQCGEQGWYGEQTLDVQAVHATAPGAKILYVAARSCDDSDFADALATIVDRHLADSVSNSWGSVGEADEGGTLSRYQAIFAQAIIEGIGMYFSSGDDGDDTVDGLPPSVDLPASNPLVTAVGGTSLGLKKTGGYSFEDGWGTGKSALVKGAWAPSVPGPFTSGGGGGASRIFDQPFYQQGVVPDALANKAGLGRPTRTVPDIAMDGDPNTGFLVGQTQTFLNGVRYAEYRIGGTSLSSPLMAGVVALADQASGFHHGFINPALYALVGTGFVHDVRNPAVTHYEVRNDYPADPTTGISDPSKPVTTSLRALNLTQSLHAAPGYDDITGVGTPKDLAFLTALGNAHWTPHR
jgi:subtilase family serine protease